MAKITDIEGIGKQKAKQLAKANVKTVEGLLKAGADKKGRKAIAEASGVDVKQILTWVNNADLFRIKGVGSEYAELMVAAGVDTIKELSRRKPANLHKKMDEVNTKKKLVRQLPSEKMVEGWVNQAKDLPKVVSH